MSALDFIMVIMGCIIGTVIGSVLGDIVSLWIKKRLYNRPSSLVRKVIGDNDKKCKCENPIDFNRLLCPKCS